MMTWRRGVLAAFLLLSVCHAKSSVRLEKVDDKELNRIFLGIKSDKHETKHGFAEDELDELAIILKKLLAESRVIDYISEQAAVEWLAKFNRDLAIESNLEAEAEWTYATNVTKANAEKATQQSIKGDTWMREQVVHVKAFLKHADRFQDPAVKRMLHKIMYGLTTPISKDPDIKRRQSEIEMKMEGIYATAKVKSRDGSRDLALDPDLEAILKTSRDYNTLLWVWEAWRDAVGPKVKHSFTQLVETTNKAAVENGMADIGESWRVVDFDDNNIEDSVVDLWGKVAPLYRSLHAYVRRKLRETYPEMKGGEKGAIPAHLLGNMWAQQWVDIYDLVKPYPEAASYDATETLLDQGYTAEKMFQLSDGFFQSLGMEPMTETFWNKSMIERPNDREVECHGSADNFYKDGDFRIKMCTSINADSLETVHHEMGHVQYYMQYAQQPTIFRDGANAAFHEAVGDTIALSVNTPKHLATIGLLPAQDHSQSDADANKESDINYLMLIALKKIVFLPFGYLIDKWRWDVFSGKVGPENYNKHWWKLRLELQGLKPPVERTEEDFDPGAKYHVASNVPYLRYFLSHIGQFQFYKVMCEAAGHTGPIHTCDFYHSKAAGQKLMDMLSLGASKSWPDAMEVMTGQRDFRAEPLLEYFQPLADWLDEQNQGEYVGWEE